jgi:hypothetical protein
MPTIPDDNELFRFGEVAFDVAQIFGVTTEQGLTRARRALNRAMIDIAGHDRKWSWLRTKSSLLTIADTREYSLEREVRMDINHFWMEGANRGNIHRVPTGKLVKAIPDPSGYSGTPGLFDYEGVDSSGCVVVSFFPTPASAIEIFYRFTKQIRPISDADKDLRSAWGIPQNMLETLTQKAAAMMIQGVNSERFKEMDGLSRALIEEAYAADQSRLNTTYRAPMHGGEESVTEGPVLPAEFGVG